MQTKYTSISLVERNDEIKRKRMKKQRNKRERLKTNLTIREKNSFRLNRRCV